MLVKDAMTKDPVFCSADDTAAVVAGIMRKNRIGGVPVIDEGRLVGIVTEADILALLNVNGPSDDLWLPSPLEIIELPLREFINWEKTKSALTDIGGTPVLAIMTSPVITTEPDVDVEEAAGIMRKNGIDRLVVVEDKKPVGIITREDIVWGVGAGTL